MRLFIFYLHEPHIQTHTHTHPVRLIQESFEIVIAAPCTLAVDRILDRTWWTWTRSQFCWCTTEWLLRKVLLKLRFSSLRYFEINSHFTGFVRLVFHRCFLSSFFLVCYGLWIGSTVFHLCQCKFFFLSNVLRVTSLTTCLKVRLNYAGPPFSCHLLHQKCMCCL